jgi:putative membrane protein
VSGIPDPAHRQPAPAGGGIPDPVTPTPAEPSAPAVLRRELRWRRLDVRMLLVHPVQEAVRFLPALAFVFISGRSNDRSPWWDLGALLAVVLFGMSRWFTTSYRVGAGQVELRTGLLRRVRLATPTDRVRTVDITAPIGHRVLGLARVQIGTGGGGVLGARIVLDALAAPEAERLRADLLHRRGSDGPTTPTASGPRGGTGATVPVPPRARGAGRARGGGRDVPGLSVRNDPGLGAEIELLRLRPGWVRYAPLTTSGLVSALTVYGFLVQYSVNALATVSGLVNRLVELGVWAALLVGLVAAVIGISVLAMSGYVLACWGLRLTRHPGGTLQVRRGLLTTRATSLEEARLRGVELGEPLGLRLVGAARLSAITTGLGRGDVETGSTVLAPPAPREVVLGVGTAICGEPEALSGRLRGHGAAARRRRHTRAFGSGAVILLGGVAAAVTWQLPIGLLFVASVPFLAAPWLARDRYAALGHRLTPRHLVTRAGCIERRRAVLARDGVVGVVVSESYFQRRAGIATLTATTAAGRQAYHVRDVPVERAWTLARELSLEAVAEFW